jgi:endonuclease/exonuclease/phosphatase family metal-dependent hydrolase
MLSVVLIVVLSNCAHRPPMAIQAIATPCHAVVADRAPLVWVAPDEARDRDRLNRWCQTVGPVVVEGGPATTAPVVADQLAIVTWNVHVGGGDVEAIVDALQEGDLTGRAAPQFVLLLQEAYREGEDVPAQLPAGAPLPRAIIERPPDGVRRDVRSIAARAGLHLFYAPAMRNGGADRSTAPEDRGAAILSTLPLADLQVIELPFERQRRVAIAADIAGLTSAGISWQLHLANVQLDTALALTRGGPIAARRRQAEALVEAINRWAARLPTVVGGDFNTWWGNKEPAVEVMRRAFPETPAGRNIPTWRGPLGTRAVLDHVFVRGRFRSVETRNFPQRLGSDHFPLLTLIDF